MLKNKKQRSNLAEHHNGKFR